MLRGAVALLSIMGAGRAGAACSLGKMAELPVTMAGMGPTVDARIDGTPVRFMADSGAFYSIISPGTARTLGLRTEPAPFGFAIIGINGSADASIATVKTLTLAGIDIPRVQFLVAGSETGGAGVIGQNILGVGDVEYDLPHGAIRLMKSQDCGHANLAYWAANRSYTIIPIAPRTAREPHTIGTVSVNGKPVRATFDTGAATSLLSLAAATRLGIKTDAPGVTDGGAVWGFGRRLVQTWIVPVASLGFGEGEQIQHARLRVGAMDGDADMLIGADFFIAHRVYVDNRNHRLFLTYEGGPVFNLKARYDGPGGKAADAPTAPATADALARDGAVAMARRDPETAIAAFSKAIALAPDEPRYLRQRADAYLRQEKPAPARADLDHALALAPGDVETRLARAELRLRDDDREGALADLDAADQAAGEAAMDRLELGSLFTDAGRPRRAVASFDAWLKTHPADVRRPEALNGRCWARALAGDEPDVAVRDCDAALRLRPGAPAILDSRGLANLRRGAFAKAIADYDAALAKAPRIAWSLYGRGIAKARLGDAAGGKADIAAAVAVRPGIAADAARYGVVP